MSNIIFKAAQEVRLGVSEINAKMRKPELINRCISINQMENSGDIVYRKALVELFAQTSDMASIVKWREIYQKMESAVDACEAFANILEGIALKYA
jgi:uncharacterized protein